MSIFTLQIPPGIVKGLRSGFKPAEVYGALDFDIPAWERYTPRRL